MNVRERVIEFLELLSQPSRQLEYETSVPLANSHRELVSWFCDDLFRPKSQPLLDAFTENEIKDLARLYGLLIESRQLRASSLADLLREPEWRRITRFAKELVAMMDAGDGSYARDIAPAQGSTRQSEGTSLAGSAFSIESWDGSRRMCR